MRSLARNASVARHVPRQLPLPGQQFTRQQLRTLGGGEYDALVARVLTSRYETGKTLQQIAKDEQMSVSTVSKITAAHVSSMLGPYLHAHRNPSKRK